MGKKEDKERGPKAGRKKKGQRSVQEAWKERAGTGAGGKRDCKGADKGNNKSFSQSRHKKNKFETVQ